MWTPEQEAIFEHFLKPKHLIIRALAGTGKTSTCVEGIKRLKKTKPNISILACAFNKKNQVDLEAKLKDEAVCLTMNGMGHRAWAKFTGKKLHLNTSKMAEIVSEITKREDNREIWADLKKLAEMAKTNGLVPQGAPKPTRRVIEDTRDEWFDMAEHYDLECSDELIDLAREAVVKSIVQAYEGHIDFNDQIYMPTLYGAAFAKYDVVVVDEAQDLNALQHIMVAQSLKLDGKLIAVGDHNQAIYGFRGALIDSIDLLESKFQVDTLPLTICWRCSKEVIRHAQRLVPELRYPDTAKLGSVTELKNWDASIFKHGDAVLCRNNAPVIALAFKLIKRGKGVAVLGRDIGLSLEKLIKKLTNDNLNTPLEDLLKFLRRWENVEIANATTKGDDAKVQKIEDKAESIRAVISFSGKDTIQGILDAINLLFSRETAPIILSTIHKAKGMEWTRVFILDPHLLCRPRLGGWALQQDINLSYVGDTRAQEDLYYVDSDNWEKQDEHSGETTGGKQPNLQTQTGGSILDKSSVDGGNTIH